MKMKLYNILFEAKKETKKSLELPQDEEITSEEKQKAYSGLSGTELQQLGTGNFIPYNDWPRFRKYMVKKVH